MNQKQLQDSITFIKSRINTSPSIGIILGSGLGSFADHLSDQIVINCKEIPHYPVSTVKGHAGLLVFGKLDNVNILALKGRVHCYEGYTMQQVTYPTRIMAELGIKSLIVTNAAGGVNETFAPGDLMLIIDHINFSFDNPLIGLAPSNEETRFVNMAQAYYRPYLQLAEKIAGKLNIPLKKGVLFVTKGPSYETAAEIRMIKILGGDAVTMSTVPEVIVANQKGIKVLGISCITNMATGISDKKLTHEDVTIAANKIKNKFLILIEEILSQMANL